MLISKIMTSAHEPGDFLVFQLESAFALLRLLAVDEADGRKVWHVTAYGDLFLDVETAEASSLDPEGLQVSAPHLALTNRAFESTQVAKIAHLPLTNNETSPLDEWRRDAKRKVSDRSVRLLLGLR